MLGKFVTEPLGLTSFGLKYTETQELRSAFELLELSGLGNDLDVLASKAEMLYYLHHLNEAYELTNAFANSILNQRGPLTNLTPLFYALSLCVG